MIRKTYITNPMLLSSFAIALLVTISSLLGLFSSYPYMQETENWQLQAWGQDLGNLVAVVVLLPTALLAKRGSLKAYLIWLGALFYFIYAFIIYAFAIHFNSLFLVYVAILGLSVYTTIGALAKGLTPIGAVDGRRLASGILLAIGVIFALLWLKEVIPASFTGKLPQSAEEARLWVNPVHVVDLAVVLPGFIVTAYLGLKNKQSGLFFIAPWLAFSVLMGTSIVFAMALMMGLGVESAAAPMVMVSIIVVTSLIGLVRYLHRVR